MKIGNREFDDFEGIYLMGILNVTPDSFSDGGKYATAEEAVDSAMSMLADGADIIDVGGESTRPGAVPITAEEEMGRVLPVIRLLRSRTDAPISVDTYHPETAEAVLNEGADMINDIWGLRYDKRMAGIIAKAKAGVCIGHNQKDITLVEDVGSVAKDLFYSCMLAHNAGIEDERIMVDPGIGFGKTQEINYGIIKNLGLITELGYPVMVGASRKSMIEYVLHLPKEERLEATLALHVMAALNGATFLRVHDVREHARALAMIKAVQAAKEE